MLLLGACGFALVLNPSVGALLLAAVAAWLWQSHEIRIPRFAGPALFLAVVVAYVVGVAARTPIAPDDLLRDVVAGRYGFDYSKMFPLSGPNLLPVSMWWAFDHTLWAVSQAIGALATVWLVQAVLAAVFAVWVAGVAKRFLPDDDRRWYWAALGLSLLAPLVLPRILLGRPEIFLTAWCAFAVLARGRVSTAVWVLAGCALSLSYWLAPLYFVGSALLPISRRGRVAVAVSLTVFHCVAWSLLTDGAFVHALLWLKDVLAAQVAPVAENTSLVSMVRSLPFAALLVAAAIAVGAQPREAITPFAIAVFFGASDQVRYVASVATFLFLTAAVGLADRLPALPAAARAALLLALPLLALHFASTSYRLSDVPAFQLPSGSLTLTSFGPGTYSVPFFASGTPGVEPSFAFGAAPRGVQQLSIELSKGRVDCASLLAWPFTHVLESSLKQVPPCLALAGIEGHWRLWQVRGRE